MKGPQIEIVKDEPLHEQVQAAIRMYRILYHNEPTTCFLNHQTFSQLENKLDFDLSFRAVTYVAPDVIWIGVE